MRALVIGAGVVGQVFGRHLARGGAEVRFLVKPKHVEEARAGFTLYPLNRAGSRRGEGTRFTEFGVLADRAEVARERWDQVYLTMSSTALRSGSWFSSVAGAIGGATVVLLQPGPSDREFVLAALPEEQLVQGIITLVGYQAPLPCETRFPVPGVAYWFPPLATTPFSGVPLRAAAVVEALRKGGLPARQSRDVSELAAFGAALMIPLIGALEAAGWRLDHLRTGEHLALGSSASREAMEIVARRRGRRPPVSMRFAARRPFIASLLRLAPLLVPFDLESYLRVHFTKVGDQTRDILKTYLDWGRRAQIDTRALARVSALASGVRPQPPRPGGT